MTDPTADLITRLIASGTPPALVAEVAMALARSEAIRAHRADARTRKARSRAHARDDRGADLYDAGDGGCDGHAASHPVTPSPRSLDKESSPRPPKEINPTPPGGERADPREADRPDGLQSLGEDQVRGAGPFPRPAFATPDVWRDFLANRRAKRLSNTASAHQRLIEDINRLADDEWPPGRLIAHAAAMGWAAVYDPSQPGPHHRKHRNAEEKTDGRHAHGPARYAARAQRRANEADRAAPISNPRLRAAIELSAGSDDAIAQPGF